MNMDILQNSKNDQKSTLKVFSLTPYMAQGEASNEGDLSYKSLPSGT